MEGVRGIMFRIPGTLPGGDCLRVWNIMSRALWDVTFVYRVLSFATSYLFIR
jgi:hypothetical protein